MSSQPRQRLAVLLNYAVENAIENNEEKYARQLATMLEKHATNLRLRFGGTRFLESRPKRVTELKPIPGFSPEESARLRKKYGPNSPVITPSGPIES